MSFKLAINSIKCRERHECEHVNDSQPAAVEEAVSQTAVVSASAAHVELLAAHMLYSQQHQRTWNYIMFGLVKLSVSDFSAISPSTTTTQHQHKLRINNSRGATKHLLAERVVAPWNSMPVEIVGFSYPSQFKDSIKLINFSKFLITDVDN